MTEFPTVRVAAIQATPVILDAEATVEKAVGLLGEAAAAGAQLAVLPETFVSLYPSNAWAKDAAAFGGWDELWEQLWANSVDDPRPARSTAWSTPAPRTRPALRDRRQRARGRNDPARSTTRCS